MEERIKLALNFIQFALEYSVDYVYVLEALEKILKGEQKLYNPENYIDY